MEFVLPDVASTSAAFLQQGTDFITHFIVARVG